MNSKTKLIYRWDKRHQDFWSSWPKSKADTNYLFGLFSMIKIPEFNTTILEELDKRGFDTKTIRFEIKLKKEIIEILEQKRKS